jgi:hypothetical protein
MSEFLGYPLGSFWIRPLDYRDATVGSFFDACRERPFSDYRRDPERERFVEERVRKRKLLSD